MEVFNHFGPPIVRFKALDSILKEALSYANQINAREEDAPFRSHRVREGFLENVEKYLLKVGTEFHKQFAIYYHETDSLEIADMWIVTQKETVWNQMHSHVGDIAGIMYLKMPEVLWRGPEPKDMHLLNPGGITFACGTPGPYHRALKTLTPATGEVYLFPTTVLHTVYPFFGPEERISFAFNLNVKKITRR